MVNLAHSKPRASFRVQAGGGTTATDGASKFPGPSAVVGPSGRNRRRFSCGSTWRNAPRGSARAADPSAVRLPGVQQRQSQRETRQDGEGQSALSHSVPPAAATLPSPLGPCRPHRGR